MMLHRMSNSTISTRPCYVQILTSLSHRLAVAGCIGPSPLPGRTLVSYCPLEMVDRSATFAFAAAFTSAFVGSSISPSVSPSIRTRSR
jgi:hypothetical protein